MISDPVDAILARHGIRDPWQPLVCTGVANRIYATRDVVLRIATDHPEAVPDARTESVAAGLEDLRDRGRFSRNVGELRGFVAQHQHRWR